MIKYVYIFFIFVLSGCVLNPPTTNSDIGVINLSGDYPTRKVDLKEIADVEYIALETTDSSLLTSSCVYFYISNDYIVTRDRNAGDIFFFDRTGKFIRRINRKGNGPEEYLNLQKIAVDFKTEECFIYDLYRKKVHIYTFDGTYKRSFPWMIAQLTPWCNYNEDYLIGYHGSLSLETFRLKDTHPFYLMSKKDGTLTPLDITVPNGISSTLNMEKVILTTGDVYYDKAFLPIDPLIMNGDEALIADFSLDTLYSFKEGTLIPIAVKNPSPWSTNPPTVIVPELYTDSFMYFRVISMYYDKSDYWKVYENAEKLVWDRKTNQVEKWSFYNSDMDATMTRYPVADGDAFSDRNMGVVFYTAETLITLNNEGKLKGKLKEVASKLKDEEDNVVLLIAKYK